jgi:hypothetical protein
MTILTTQINPRSADFVANAAVMNALVADLEAKAVALQPEPSKRRGASSCRVSAWICSWMQARHF